MLLLVSLASCGQAATGGQPAQAGGSQTAVSFPGTPGNDTVVLDITAEPMEMNSMLTNDVIAMGILAQCVSGLTRLDQNDKPVADLAESWEISEDSTVYTVHLREDALWANGDPVTAGDYYFAWVTQLKPETGAPLAAFLYENIKNAEAFYQGEAEESELGIEVVDDHTIKIEWARPMPEAEGLFFLSRPSYLPVNQKAYEAAGAEAYAKEADTLLTNGAYRITEWVHDDHISLEKSDSYHGAAKVQIPKIKLVMLADANTRLNAFMTGEIDLSNLYSEQIAQVKEKDEAALDTYFDGASWYLGFNANNQYLANKNLRQALAYSIDVQSLLDNVIADGSVVADGLIPSTVAGAGGQTYASARGSLFAYDLEKAKASFETALAELGVTADEISLTLDVGNTPYSQNQAAYIQQQWQQNLGLNVTVNAQPWGALQEAKANGDFNISVEVNTCADNTAMSMLKFFTAENEMGYANAEYDQLVAAAGTEADPQKKQDLMIQAEGILLEDMAVGPMYFTCTTYAVSNKLQGLVRTPFQYFNVIDGAAIAAQ